jgi:hypothetical protein
MTGHELLAWLQLQSSVTLARRVVRDDNEDGPTDVEPRTEEPIMQLHSNRRVFEVPTWIVVEEVIRL